MPAQMTIGFPLLQNLSEKTNLNSIAPELMTHAPRSQACWSKPPCEPEVTSRVDIETAMAETLALPVLQMNAYKALRTMEKRQWILARRPADRLRLPRTERRRGAGTLLEGGKTMTKESPNDIHLPRFIDTSSGLEKRGEEPELLDMLETK